MAREIYRPARRTVYPSSHYSRFVASQCVMSFSTTFQLPWSPVHSGAVLRSLAHCLDISAVWSIDHEPDESYPGLDHIRLLAFADPTTLARLRRSQYLHRSAVEFLVVVDGDAFASAWGPGNLSGSLARWVWRQTSAREAYYDESRWSGNDGAVMRVRRKAFLIWEPPVAR